MKEFAETNGANITHYNLMETSLSPEKKNNDFKKSKNNSKIITENTIMSQNFNENEESIRVNKMSRKEVILFYLLKIR